MEANLLERLQQKLGELEEKQRACRLQSIAEFQDFYQDLLRGVPSDTARNVQRAITASFTSYPTLRPKLLVVESHPSENPRSAAFQSSRPAAACGKSETTRSSLDRDRELRGLFTPTYLPLLESLPMLPSAAPADQPPHVESASLRDTRTVQMQENNTLDTTRSEDRQKRTDIGDAAVEQPLLPLRLPQHLLGSMVSSTNNGAADDARSSTSSDKGDPKPTRSALRRSSSMSKAPQSPRRVRFEFMGAEVLPTSSPQASAFAAPRRASPEPEDEFAFGSDQSGDVTEDEQTPPRKVSSSDALRALSRAPLEEGTIWTVVNADVDDAASDSPAVIEEPHSSPLEQSQTQIPYLADPSPEVSSDAEEATASAQEIDPEQEEYSDDAASSDEEFLAIAGTRRSSLLTPGPISTTLDSVQDALKSKAEHKADNDENGSHEALQGASCYEDESDDDGKVFVFEADGSTSSPQPKRKPPPLEAEEDQGLEHDNPSVDVRSSGDYLSTSATSTPRPIRSPSNFPSTSGAPLPSEMVGSYKGRPLMMPIVKDPVLLEQAQDLPASTVKHGEDGSEDGSPDPGLISSLSFKQRFAMEEIMAMRRANGHRRKASVSQT